MPGDRRSAIAIQRQQEGAFRGHAKLGARAIELAHQRIRFFILAAHSNADGALGAGRKHSLRLRDRTGHISGTETVETRHRQIGRIRLARLKLLEPSLHIAAKNRDPKIRACRQYLRLAPK